MKICKPLFVLLLVGLIAGPVSACGPEGGPLPLRLAIAKTSNRSDLPDSYLSSPAGAFGEDQITVAILLPLSGDSAEAGRALLDAASLALFESYDPRIRLVPIDTKGTPDGALNAAIGAVEASAEVILGPLFAESIAAAKPVARDAGIPLIGFSNDRSVAGEGAYLLSFMPDQEVRRVVAQAAAEGRTRFAAMIPESDYGERVFRAFSDAVRQNGGTITALEFYARDPQSIAAPVRRLADYDKRRRAFVREEAFLKGLNDDLANELLEKMKNKETIGEVAFDTVLLPEGGRLLRSLAPLLPFYEIDPAQVRFLGTGLWDDRSLVHEPPLRGGIYATANPEGAEAFLLSFQETFGYGAPRIATLAYDAMALVSNLARNEIKEERFSADAFENANGFMGVDGPFRFASSGVVARRLAVVEIRADGFHTISEAPKTFEETFFSAIR